MSLVLSPDLTLKGLCQVHRPWPLSLQSVSEQPEPILAEPQQPLQPLQPLVGPAPLEVSESGWGRAQTLPGTPEPWKLPRPSSFPKVLWAADLASLGLSLSLHKMMP